MNEQIKHIHRLIELAAQAHSAHEAMQYAQAAQNSAQAFMTLGGVPTRKGRVEEDQADRP